MAPPLATNTQLERFRGIAPLFPLPSVALFPHAVRPLHVFEERYRILTEHALNAERLIAMAVLRPGWETGYERNDLDLEPVVCLAQIDVDHRLPDGRYLLLLRGLTRGRITAELPLDQPYRRARLQLLPDSYPAEPTIDRHQRRRELLELFQQLHPEAAADVLQILDADFSLGGLCDALAAAGDLGIEESRALLGEPQVDARSDLLLDSLRRRIRRRDMGIDFPPTFSTN